MVVKLRAPAIDGKANKRLIELLSNVLKLSKTDIVLRKGHTSRIKCMEINAEEYTVQQSLKKAIDKHL
jgi:uncharacterized protein (TIGR00251 family)